MPKSLLFALLIVVFTISAASGETLSYTKTVRQVFGGGQSPDAAARSALSRAKREALEEAGTYLESMTVVRDAAVVSDDILALAAGVLKAQIVSRKNFMEGEQFGIEVTARVEVETAVMEGRVKALLSDRASLDDIKKLRLREGELLGRIHDLEAKNRELLQHPDKKREKQLAGSFSETGDELDEVDRQLEAKFAAIARDLADIKQSTGRIEQSQERMALSLEKISKGFEELSRQGVLNLSPKTPEEFYSNARIYELRGDYGNARRMYMEYFRFGLDFIDPHLRFQAFLKVQEGREGAREVYEYLKGQGKGFVLPFVALFLQDREARLRGLEDFAARNPDFGPVYYELSRDFSEARLPGRSLEDKRREKQYLEKLLATHKTGHFVRWFLDKGLVAEYLADAEKRLAELGASAGLQLEKPVNVSWMKSNAGWTATMMIAEPATEVFYRLDPEAAFKSTGFTQVPNPVTGKPMPQLFIMLPHTDKTLRLWVKYSDRNGRTMGPWDFTLDPGSEAARGDKSILEMTKPAWLAFGDFNGEKLLYFTHLMSWRGALSRVFYGINREEPDTELKFPAHRGSGTAGITDDVPTFIKLPATVRFVTVRLVYFDDSRSDVVRFPVQ